MSISDQRWQFLVLALAMLLTFLLNTLLLRRRFEPLERLLAMMERVDLSRPGRRLELDPEMAGDSTDIERLAATFNRMLERLENERRRSGELVLRAQEEERRRVARDLHDEVNQSLTALLLRIEAAAQDAPPELRPQLEETRQLADQAMGELLDLARQLRPTALDDHGLVAALTHARARARPARGRPARASGPTPAGRAVAGRAGGRLPRRAGGARQRRPPLGREPHRGEPRAARLAGAPGGVGQRLGVRLRRGGQGLGLSGMRERALLVGGTLEIDSRPGKGTSVVLEVPAEPRPPEAVPEDDGGSLKPARTEPNERS